MRTSKQKANLSAPSRLSIFFSLSLSLMDSGNSTSSLQSSSGGEEEYDSRADAVFNNPPPTLTHVAPFTNASLPLPPQHRHIFHPSSDYLDPIQRSPSLLNLDMAWSKPGRSESNPADLGAGAGAGATNFGAAESGCGSRGLLVMSVSAPNDQIQNQTHNNNSSSSASASNNVVRNPKKRSRASRRAPTTVLTTDTTNFRAMVQEFTGIPAPPFTNSSSFSIPRTRFDLLATSSNPNPNPNPPPYYNLLRSQPHHSFLSSLPAFPSTVQNHNDVITLPSHSHSTSTPNSNSNFYQFSSSDLALLKQPLNINMHNPLFNFPSSSHHQLQDSLGILAASKTQAQGSLGMGVLEELGLNHVHGDSDNTGNNVSGLQNMVSTSSGADNDGHGGAVRSVSASGNFSNSERITNGKANYSDFHGDKGEECVAATMRSEGMVESWINCSSD